MSNIDSKQDSPVYIPPSKEESAAFLESKLLVLERLSITTNGSGISPTQLKNVIDHMFTSRVCRCPDLSVNGGRHNVLTDSGKAVSALNPYIGGEVLSLGYAMCLTGVNVLGMVAAKRGIDPDKPVRGEIFRLFLFKERPYNPQKAYDALLNTPYSAELISA